jgi:D-lyxose ketol-isomerase
MSAADDLIRSHGFNLPPFAYWSVDEFQARKYEAKHIVDMPLLAGHFL